MKKTGIISSKIGGAFKKMMSIVFWLFLGLIMFSLLGGYINQRKTGESYMQYYENLSYKVGNYILSHSNKDNILDNTGLKATKDGIYFDNAKPTDKPAVEKPQATDGAPVVN